MPLESLGYRGSRLACLARGLLVLAALALPALGTRIADTPPRLAQTGAMQAAAVWSPPPAGTAAAFRLR